MGHERDDKREAWLTERRRMEEQLQRDRRRHARGGLKPISRLMQACALLNYFLAACRLSPLLARQAARFAIERHSFAFADLPPAFHGYTILHLSDLHVGTVPGLMAEAGRRLAGEVIDLVVLTGDYQTQGKPSAAEAAGGMAPLLQPLAPADGMLAVLGNHDDHGMAAALEGLGVRVLANQRVTVRRGDDRLHVLGTDDPHAFHTQEAEAMMAEPPAGFSLALVHTPDFADLAATAGHRLYLCGHTHGGQICLPGGRPIVTALDRHRHLASGRWRLGAMQGYTSRALGSSMPPLRINCPAEATIIRLACLPDLP